MDYSYLTQTPNLFESPIEQIFYNRGIQPDDIQHYLHTTKEDILDPLLLENMDTGAKMLLKHLALGSKIFIQIDSDADGYTSAAALINYINMRFPGTAQANISYTIHTGKQHGINLEVIPKDTKLLIIPDAGSNDFEQQLALWKNNTDVLILDHHESDIPICEFACRINNQTCDYPNKTLSGVGVVYKFCQYVDSLIDDGQNCADNILDLVSIGMIADMMQLTEYETRELILEGFNNLRNPFIKAFVDKQSYSLRGELTPFGVSFYIAPYINAVIRLGTFEEKLLLFESMLDFKAYEQISSTKRGCKGWFETRVEQACRNCTNVKSRQTRARDTSLEIIRKKIQDENLLNLPILIIQLAEPVEENLTGLIANQIANEYQRPTLILNSHIEYDNTTGEITCFEWRGSGRNTQFSKLDNFREFLVESNFVKLAQGHASAFGCIIDDNCITQLKDYITNKLKDFDFNASYKVDFIWNYGDLDRHIQDILDIGFLHSIWGQGIPEPQIAIENIQIHSKDLKLMSPDKSPTIKIQLDNNLSLIKFKASQEEFESLKADGITIINIVGTCNLNEWGGNISPQILIEDYEIINKTNYIF